MRIRSFLKEKVLPKYSMSEIDLIFKATDFQSLDKRADFFFDQFHDLPTDTVLWLWDYYLGEAMQTGNSSGINSTIGFNRRYGYDTELEEL